jgi:hypothetical protein
MGGCGSWSTFVGWLAACVLLGRLELESDEPVVANDLASCPGSIT